MTNGRFHPPKLQKMGVLYTHSPKRPSPFLKLLKNRKKHTPPPPGGGAYLTRPGAAPQPVGNC
jgi:hypothetical protein